MGIPTLPAMRAAGQGRIINIDMRLKNPLFRGRTLTAGGELGNLFAYGFAPAAIVAPVGSVGVL